MDGQDIKTQEVTTLIPGVEYLLETSEKDIKKSIRLVFCHKDSMGVFVHGITSEGLLQVLLQRYQTIINKSDTPENIQCLLFLRQALQQMKMRTKRTKATSDDKRRDGIPVSVGGQQG